MTAFQVWVLCLLGLLAFAVFYVGAEIRDLRREVAEIWKRMKRLD